MEKHANMKFIVENSLLVGSTNLDVVWNACAKHVYGFLANFQLPQFCFIFQVLHKAFAGGVMIDNGDIVALIRVQYSDIHFNKCFVLPQWCRCACVEIQFLGDFLYEKNSVQFNSVAQLKSMDSENVAQQRKYKQIAHWHKRTL